MQQLTHCDEIIDAVAVHFGIAVHQLTGRNRSTHLNIPRKVAILLCRELVPFATLKTIGRAFHRDHSTITSALQVITSEIEITPSLRRDYEALRAQLAPQPEPVSAPVEPIPSSVLTRQRILQHFTLPSPAFSGDQP